jgi:hypothetical protein
MTNQGAITKGFSPQMASAGHPIPSFPLPPKTSQHRFVGPSECLQIDPRTVSTFFPVTCALGQTTTVFCAQFIHQPALRREHGIGTSIINRGR